MSRWTLVLVPSLALGCSDAGNGSVLVQPEAQAGAATGGSGAGGQPANIGGAPTVVAGGGPGVVVIPPSQGGTAGTPDVMNGECEQLEFESMRAPVDVLLVLDRSGSMADNEIEDGVSRWEGIVPVLNSTVTSTDATVGWGLKTFPEGVNNLCEETSVTTAIDVPIAPANGAQIVAAVDATQPNGAGTPTAQALAAAVTYLSGRTTDHQQFILLATDGQPSCTLDWDEDSDGASDDARGAATAAFQAGFPVYVVGVLDEDPSDSTVETLNGMALSGGKPTGVDGDEYRFYLASSQEALTQSLTEITGQVASCVFPFESAPPDAENIAVKLDGKKLSRDASRADGWDYTDAEHRGIELYGSACEQLKQGSQNSVQVIFGCPGRPLT
jgi:Mg-chelatase subunit ChlD